MAAAVVNLYNRIDKPAAWKNVACFHPRSAIGTAAWIIIAVNAPHEIVTARYFYAPGIPPGLKPSHYDDDTPVFSVEDVAQGLGHDSEVVHALVEAFAGLETGRETGAASRVQ
jgi:hypothetical protein